LFTDLVLKTLDDEPGFFEVVNDVFYTWTDEDQIDHRYIVVAGTKTDLASIPRFLRWAFNRTGRSRKPAVFHDDMYSKKWRTRKECDQMFKQMLIERGVSRWSAAIYYSGVRAGGWTRGRW